MYDIEKDVPLPIGGRNRIEFPLAKMEAGDSFTAPPKSRATLILRIREYRSIEPTREFITRIIGEELRCWRVR